MSFNCFDPFDSEILSNSHISSDLFFQKNKNQLVSVNCEHREKRSLKKNSSERFISEKILSAGYNASQINLPSISHFERHANQMENEKHWSKNIIEAERRYLIPVIKLEKRTIQFKSPSLKIINQNQYQSGISHKTYFGSLNAPQNQQNSFPQKILTENNEECSQYLIQVKEVEKEAEKEDDMLSTLVETGVHEHLVLGRKPAGTARSVISMGSVEEDSFESIVMETHQSIKRNALKKLI